MTQNSTPEPSSPNLHNKYLNLYHDAKLHERAANEYNRLYKLKWEYYTGKIDEKPKTKGKNLDHKILRNDISLHEWR